MHKLNLLVDNALIGLIQDLTEASKYDEASLVLNKVELEENLLRAADMIGSHLVVDKLTDRTTRRYLKCLMTSKISAKYAEQDLDLSLLQRIIDITQNAPEAIDVGNQVYNLLYDAGLVS